MSHKFLAGMEFVAYALFLEGGYTIVAFLPLFFKREMHSCLNVYEHKENHIYCDGGYGHVLDSQGAGRHCL